MRPRFRLGLPFGRISCLHPAHRSISNKDGVTTKSISSVSHMPRSYAVTFPLTLTTVALYQSRLRRFEACSCKPAPRDLPSSLVQLRTLYIKVRSWRTYPNKSLPDTLTQLVFSAKPSGFFLYLFGPRLELNNLNVYRNRTFLCLLYVKGDSVSFIQQL
jgi:hypothetical protein